MEGDWKKIPTQLLEGAIISLTARTHNEKIMLLTIFSSWYWLCSFYIFTKTAKSHSNWKCSTSKYYIDI